MSVNLKRYLESEPVETSAPCRIDMGGTLDISTFYYPLRHLNPSTFNIALDLRTHVRLLPYDASAVKVSSRGFESAEYPVDSAPFDHPMGLMFAIAAYFQAEGVHIDIESTSPPKSGLGGSSVAAVALIAAFSNVLTRIGVYRQLYRREIAILAHALEESVAGVPCGLQDQLAAAYGGVNSWRWHGRVKEAVFEKDAICKKAATAAFQKHLLIAYCGIPHESRNINQCWVRDFVAGKHRSLWAEIIHCTQKFTDALKRQDVQDAVEAMNHETLIRKEMTPDVMDDLADRLAEAARSEGCGARFTGAGGGGCMWALGETAHIDRLRDVWEKILIQRPDARLLDADIDTDGLLYRCP
jgi:D-glycero-alpha-D-manno-heptose-7-phosphate kinase